MKIEMTEADLRSVCDELATGLECEMDAGPDYSRMDYPEITAEWRRQSKRRDEKLADPETLGGSVEFQQRVWRECDEEADRLDRLAAQLGPRKID